MRSRLQLFSLLFFIIIFENANAQCNVIGDINASDLICSIAPLSACGGIVNIGDGTNAMTLTMDTALDLSCLGPIQLIVKNAATLDFTSGNDYLVLAAGSSIVFQPGADLMGQSCNASERIYIGTNLVASCNGNAGAEYSFEELLNFGGYNIVTGSASPTAICDSGSVTFNANPIPSIGALIRWYSVPSGGTPISTMNPYGPIIISSTTTYYVEAYYASSGFTTQRIPVIATVYPISIWNGSSWSIPPSSTTSLIFNGNYSSTGNLSGCSCTVNNGSVVFNAGHTLNLTNALNVAGGILTFNNNSSLVQVNNSINTGSITYNRNTTPVVKFDYTYWSSPTSGFQTLLDFSPNTSLNRFFTYDNSWQNANPSVDVFVKGLGYAIWAPQSTNPITPTILPHQFIGVPNNGNVDIPVSVGPPISNKLLGNPYPSALDANAFINANIVGTGTINKTISGTLYFWTHNHSLVGNNYSQADYATYNLTGGTAVSTGTGNTTAPTQYIAAGQGIFINQVANGNVSFRNSMRTGVNNSNFYRMNNSDASESALEKHRIWLNFTNDISNFSQALIGYVKGATNSYDPGYDGLHLGINEFGLYSLINDKAYTIQARPLSHVKKDDVPIGFKTNNAGESWISLDHTDGLFSEEQSIFLEDKMLNIVHDLKQSPYSFLTEKGVFDNRFVLSIGKQAHNNSEISLNENTINIYTLNNSININSYAQNIDNYIVYDSLGQIVVSKDNVKGKQSEINSIVKNNQVLIVKITFENGQTMTKKIIF